MIVALNVSPYVIDHAVIRKATPADYFIDHGFVGLQHSIRRNMLYQMRFEYGHFRIFHGDQSQRAPPLTDSENHLLLLPLNLGAALARLARCQIGFIGFDNASHKLESGLYRGLTDAMAEEPSRFG